MIRFFGCVYEPWRKTIASFLKRTDDGIMWAEPLPPLPVAMCIRLHYNDNQHPASILKISAHAIINQTGY